MNHKRFFLRLIIILVLLLAAPLVLTKYYGQLLTEILIWGILAMALDLMRTYYGRWLAAGATTFGEHYHMSWLRGKQRLDFEYEVHAYGTSAHLHFYNNILGIRPLEPGFRRALIAPHPGDLEWAEGQIPTPLGTIQVSWKVIGSAFVMDVEAPEACVCEVVPPENWADCQVRINGKVVAKAAHMPRFASRS